MDTELVHAHSVHIELMVNDLVTLSRSFEGDLACTPLHIAAGSRLLPKRFT